MAITKITDVVKVPELMTRHITQAIAEQSELIQSRAATSNELINQAVQSDSMTIKIPFNNGLSGRSKIYDETDIQISNITSGSQKGVAQLRYNAWGATDLAIALSGNDKMGAIAADAGRYWSDDIQESTDLVLDGVFASASMASHVVSVEYENGANIKDILAEAVLDAKKSLGKAGNKLSVIRVSPNLHTEMQKANLVTNVRDPNSANINFDLYLGQYQIIVSKNLADDEFYLFGEGAIFIGDGSDTLPNSTEVGRDPIKNGGQDFMINRRKFMIHVNGVSYTGSIAGDSATDAEVSNGANWTRVYESENVLALKVTLSEAAPA